MKIRCSPTAPGKEGMISYFQKSRLNLISGDFTSEDNTFLELCVLTPRIGMYESFMCLYVSTGEIFQKKLRKIYGLPTFMNLKAPRFRDLSVLQNVSC